ncbi:hypothetical protein [Klebsiella aerogenes]|uniref:hypothetical protein n=1 Tax=Klebsiella aerogenes TaxID=548 RepID=UPI00140FC949|nr:hypothetical protein [Klebsiella aerogenes]QIP24152.1 hypothetical protein HA513_07205 [Klebsiella aerogenes]
MKGLEKAFAPHILANLRFVTHIFVEQQDPRNGSYEDIESPDNPIAELIIYTSTRRAYRTKIKHFERHYARLEG